MHNLSHCGIASNEDSSKGVQAMKQYMMDNGITLVGKAWEIRHQLKLLGKDSKTGACKCSLHEYLQSTRPHAADRP